MARRQPEAEPDPCGDAWTLPERAAAPVRSGSLTRVPTVPAATVSLEKFDLPRYLGTLALFSSVDAVQRQRLAAGCRLRRFARGAMIFRVGDHCAEFHVVVTGHVKLFAMSSAGVEKVVQLCGPGRSFGEGVMFLGAPYVLSAQALADTLLLTIGRATVLREIETSPEFGLRMLAGLSERLHGLVRDVEAYALHSGTQRVIGYLLGDHPRQVHPDEGRESISITLPVSKAAIASRLSITPEYFSRVLSELVAAGLIVVERRTIHIPDVARLAACQPP